MRSLGFNGSTVNLIMAGGVNIVQFLAVLPAILYIDSWGGWSAQLNLPSSPSATSSLADRKEASPPNRQRRDGRIAPAYCPAGKSSAVSTISRRTSELVEVFEFGGEWSDHPAATWVAVRYATLLHAARRHRRIQSLPSCVYLFTVAYGTSIGPIGWVLPNEVFPLSMRGKGAALSAASNWLNNCMSATHGSCLDFLKWTVSLYWSRDASTLGELASVSLFQHDIVAVAYYDSAVSPG